MHCNISLEQSYNCSSEVDSEVVGFIKFSQYYGLIISMVGCIGNLLTIATIVYQLNLKDRSACCRNLNGNQMNRVPSVSQSMCNQRRQSTLQEGTILHNTQKVTTVQESATLENQRRQSTLQESATFAIQRDLSTMQGSTTLSNQQVREAVQESSHLNNQRRVSTLQGSVTLHSERHLSNIQMPATFSNKNISSTLQRPTIFRTADTYFLLHLAVCDFLYCSVNMPLTIIAYSKVIDNSCPSEQYCIYATFFRYIIAYTEWMTLAILMVERSVDVRNPNNNKFFTPSVAYILCFSTWMLSTALQIPNFVSNNSL